MTASVEQQMPACEICGTLTHSIEHHLKQKHPAISIDEYKTKYPNAPLFSQEALRRLEEMKRKKAEEPVVAAMAGTVHAFSATPTGQGFTHKALHELFELGSDPAALSGKKQPIMLTVLDRLPGSQMIPDIDSNHVYDIDILKNIMMAIELRMPLYAWGHAGTGKTTTLEQACARTNRTLLRVQHTANTEESHVLGLWTVKGGQTIFSPGPLALAMRNGWVYLADEYDFAMPAVLAVYQPVLEGKSLVIKEAQGTEWGVVQPHPNFRFFATGNTNGSGDETGLYMGTSIQNAANYDRFQIVLEFKYMSQEMEAQVIVGQAQIEKKDALHLVDFAKRVREAYEGNQISNTISPRTLISAAKIGMLRGSFRTGLTLSFINKLSNVDREVVGEVAQRVFGNK